MRQPTIVAAGYGSWAMTAKNPAWAAVTSLSTYQPRNYRLHCIEAPVDSNALYGWIDNALEEFSPDIWVGVGVAVGSPAIRLEQIGINIRCFSVPDIQGRILEPTPIYEDGPVAYQASLNNGSIVEQMRNSGIPAIESFHAGTHLCNQMLYTVQHLTACNNLNLISGFIHVPQSTDNASALEAHEVPCCSMSIAMMTQAIKIAVECAVIQYGDAGIQA